MQSKDKERARTTEENPDRKPVDKENLDSVAGAAVPVSIEVGGSGSPSGNTDPDKNTMGSH